MKLTHSRRGETATHHFVQACLNSCAAIRQAVIRIKETVLNEYFAQVGEHVRVLRLALNEAEALAWQSDYPHLLFPVLATEKAQAAVSWHQQQRALRHAQAERAFVE